MNKLLFNCRKSNTVLEKEELVEFKQSILLTNSNDTFPVLARFLSEKDEVQILLGDATCVLFKEKTQAIAIGNRVLVRSDYPHNDQFFHSYFDVISEGNVLLLKNEENVFFYKKEEQPAQKVKRSKKSLSKLFPESVSLINKKKLNIKKDRDLIRLFEFMNESVEISMR